MKESAFKILITSPPLWSAVGCVIVTIPISPSGSCLFAVGLVLTAINELRLGSSEPIEQQRSGVVGLAAQKFYSPGIFPFIQCCSYLWSFVDAFIHGKTAHSFVMLTYAVGCIALERIANYGYQPQSRKKLKVEKFLQNLWSRFPNNLRVVLQDPGAIFCAANVALLLLDFDFSGIMDDKVILVTFGIGFTLACIGLVRGFAPLLCFRQFKLTGTACMLGGVGDIFLGVSALKFGSPYTGTAMVLWGISNILYGRRITRRGYGS